MLKVKLKIIKIRKIGTLCKVDTSHKIKVGKRYEILINQEWKGNIDNFIINDKVMRTEEENKYEESNKNDDRAWIIK